MKNMCCRDLKINLLINIENVNMLVFVQKMHLKKHVCV